MKRFVTVGQDSRGNTLFVEIGAVGERIYWSDEIGDGVVVWNTTLVSAEMMRLALDHEAGKDPAEVPV